MQRVALPFLLLAAVASAQANLRVNEFGTGTPDYIEIANLGPDIAYMTGYQVKWGYNSTSFQSGTFTFPGGVVLYPGQCAIITDTVNASTPSAPLGTYKAYMGANIPWTTAPTGNGCVSLLDPLGVGVDAVQWGSPTTSFSTLFGGTTFTGVVTMTAAAGQRRDNADTNVGADWVSVVAATPGLLTPASVGVAGQSIIVGVTHTMSTTGGGQFSLAITTSNAPLAGAEVYNLVSLIDLTPNGSGPVFGLATDVINLALTPAAIGNPFHTFLDGAGLFSIDVPAGVLPLGLTFEGVAVVVSGGVVKRISTVSQVTL
jgi:hypothetical protein